MEEPEKPHEKDQKGGNFFWNRQIEFASGALMLVGIILSFFYVHIGGALVGLAFGMCFFEEIRSYFFQLGEFYIEQGLFKTLMLIATILYFLITIPAFIIATAIGFGVIYLIRWSLQKK
jgi:hypothetical protein